MKTLRTNPPKELGGSKLVSVLDYQEGTATDMETNAVENLNFPKSNVLQFLTEDGTKVSARPSGTEPKIKFYFSVRAELKDPEDFDAKFDMLGEKIDRIINEIKN